MAKPPPPTDRPDAPRYKGKRQRGSTNPNPMSRRHLARRAFRVMRPCTATIRPFISTWRPGQPIYWWRRCARNGPRMGLQNRRNGRTKFGSSGSSLRLLHTVSLMIASCSRCQLSFITPKVAKHVVPRLANAGTLLRRGEHVGRSGFRDRQSGFCRWQDSRDDCLANAHAAIPSNATALSPIVAREPETDGLSHNREDCNMGCVDN
jgi:hypothetical protein